MHSRHAVSYSWIVWHLRASYLKVYCRYAYLYFFSVWYFSCNHICWTKVIRLHCRIGTIIVTSAPILGKSRNSPPDDFQQCMCKEYSSTFGCNKMQSYWIYKKTTSEFDNTATNSTAALPEASKGDHTEYQSVTINYSDQRTHHMTWNASHHASANPRSQPCRVCLDEQLQLRPSKVMTDSLERKMYDEARSASRKSKKHCAKCRMVLCAEHQASQCKFP